MDIYGGLHDSIYSDAVNFAQAAWQVSEGADSPSRQIGRPWWAPMRRSV